MHKTFIRLLSFDLEHDVETLHFPCAPIYHIGTERNLQSTLLYNHQTVSDFSCAIHMSREEKVKSFCFARLLSIYPAMQMYTIWCTFEFHSHSISTQHLTLETQGIVTFSHISCLHSVTQHRRTNCILWSKLHEVFKYQNIIIIWNVFLHSTKTLNVVKEVPHDEILFILPIWVCYANLSFVHKGAQIKRLIQTI